MSLLRSPSPSIPVSCIVSVFVRVCGVSILLKSIEASGEVMYDRYDRTGDISLFTAVFNSMFADREKSKPYMYM